MKCTDCIFYHYNTEYSNGIKDQEFHECNNEYEIDPLYIDTNDIDDDGAEECIGFCKDVDEVEYKYGDT